uniref:Uncharacterized protein n=1 Tax=Proboscia inermis TaxID=420281 RepID=A0A7S0GEI5_9STRA
MSWTTLIYSAVLYQMPQHQLIQLTTIQYLVLVPVQSDLFYFEQLYGLCKDMRRFKNFANKIGDNILGLCTHKHVRSKPNALPINEVLDFLAETCLRCTWSSDILILAMDDVE